MCERHVGRCDIFFKTHGELLPRYALHLKNGLAEMAQQVPDLTLESVADAFVDFMLVLQSQHSFSIALVDARGGSVEERARFREAMRAGVAVVPLHTLKGVISTANEEPVLQAMILAEIRELVRTHRFGHCLSFVRRGRRPLERRIHTR